MIYDYLGQRHDYLAIIYSIFVIKLNQFDPDQTWMYLI